MRQGGLVVLSVLAAFASARAEAPTGALPESGRLPVGASEVVGKDAPSLLGLRNTSFRVYAFRGGSAAPIPFQVDERDKRDHWVDDEGPQPVRDDSPGIFDDNDVIVFMNRDLGSRGDPAKLPEGAAK